MEENPEVPLEDDEKQLLEEEAEAFAIAEEATKTLQQAREAVQKARQARGYFPLGGKGSSSPSFKGPSSGKGRGFRPSGKGAPGVCTACGRPGHRYYECPSRSKGKGFSGKPSGKKGGKSKGGKGFKGKGSDVYSSDLGYATVFSFEVVKEQEDESGSDVACSSFVLSCDGAVPSKVRASEVIVDTGATESACGIETMRPTKWSGS